MDRFERQREKLKNRSTRLPTEPEYRQVDDEIERGTIEDYRLSRKEKRDRRLRFLKRVRRDDRVEGSERLIDKYFGEGESPEEGLDE